MNESTFLSFILILFTGTNEYGTISLECQRKLLNMPVVERLIAEHESGKRDHNRQLWTLLTLEQWHRSFIDDFKTD